MSFLRGGTKALFGELLSPMYLAAVVRSRAVTYGNDGTLTGSSAPRACRARVDSATQRMREAVGFVETDRAIYVLAASLEGAPLEVGNTVEVLEGDYAGQRFKVESLDRPPGASYFLSRGSVTRG